MARAAESPDRCVVPTAVPTFGYVVDFFAFDCDLTVEVDGPVHLEHEQHDIDKDVRLGCEGIAVLRFTNEDDVNDLSRIVEEIRQAVALRRGRNMRARRQATWLDPPRFGELTIDRFVT